MLGRTTLHWAPGSRLNEVGSPLEERVIDETEFSFFIYLYYGPLNINEIKNENSGC